MKHKKPHVEQLIEALSTGPKSESELQTLLGCKKVGIIMNQANVQFRENQTGLLISVREVVTPTKFKIGVHEKMFSLARLVPTSLSPKDWEWKEWERKEAAKLSN